MPKKKSSSRKKTSKTKRTHSKNTEKVLIENFVSLQKVMTNLSVKFDNLTVQISKLLELFEISAKNLAKKDFSFEKEIKIDKDAHKKIDTLLEQNKIIARGLTLLHEGNPQQRTQQQTNQQMNPPRPLPVNANQGNPARMEIGGYQKSISSRPLPNAKNNYQRR